MVGHGEQHSGTANDRSTAFSYVGLTDQVSSEVRTPKTTGTATTRSYSYDAAGRRVGMADSASGKSYTYGYDPHGSVSVLLEEDGEVEATYGYTPYGKADTTLTKGDTDPANPTNPYRYTGRRIDPVSGTLDMGARRFSPEAMHFLTQDVLSGALADLSLTSDPLTQNRYALAGGNPVSFVEWDGHIPVNDDGDVNHQALDNHLRASGFDDGCRCVDRDPDTAGSRSAVTSREGPPTALGTLIVELRVIATSAESRCAEIAQSIGISRTDCTTDIFVSRSGDQLAGFNPGALGLPVGYPGGVQRQPPPREIVGSSGWKPALVDEDESPARHFLGHLRMGYRHPTHAEIALVFAEAPGQGGASQQDVRSGRIALHFASRLRNRDLAPSDFIGELPSAVGDPQYAGGPRRAEEPRVPSLAETLRMFPVGGGLFFGT